MLELLGIVIIALSAILSPLVTGLLNNRHSKKMREMEIKEMRTQVFEKFLADYGYWTVSKSTENRDKSGSSLFPAYLYASEDTKQKIEELMYDRNVPEEKRLLEVAKSFYENELSKKK